MKIPTCTLVVFIIYLEFEKIGENEYSAVHGTATVRCILTKKHPRCLAPISFVHTSFDRGPRVGSSSLKGSDYTLKHSYFYHSLFESYRAFLFSKRNHNVTHHLKFTFSK
jgi:hypothetical protein